MCDVNDIGTGEEDDPTIHEDDALEKIFSECDVPSTGRVSVAKLIGYMRDRMSAHGSPKILKDLHKLMSVVSRDGDTVTREQYYAASQVWLAKIRKRQHYQGNHQDGNNNLHVDHNSDNFNDDPVSNELSGNTSRIRTTLVLAESNDDIHLDDAAGSGSDSDARNIQGYHDLSTSTVVDTNERCDSRDAFFGDLSSVDGTFHMAIDHPVAETAQGLRQRAQRCAIDNDHLREELQRAEDSIASLEKQLVTIGHKLELANTRCERLQGEHEENRDLLASAEKDRKALEARNHRLDKENCQLKKEIEAAETETRRLNAELDRANGQKEERIRLLSRCRQELIERQTLYDEAKRQISHLEITNDQIKEKYDISTGTTEHLKVVVKELETRIAELQPNQNYILHGEELFANSSSDNYGADSVTEIFQTSEKMTPCSLLDEMKATAGFGDPEVDVEVCRNSNDTIEDRNTNSIEYIDAMRWATEQLERATAELSASNKELGIGPSPSRNPVVTAQPFIQTGDEVVENEDHFSSKEDLRHFKSQIRHVLTILSLMASRKVMNADTKDATTQVDCLDSIISELPQVCNIHAAPGTDSFTNNNDINYGEKFCPTCKRENRSPKKEDEVLTVDGRPEVAPVKFTSPLVPPLDGLSSTPRETSTPCCSPPLSTSPLSSGYFREQEIIVPIVAALDEIIQGTSGSSNDGEAVYSPMGSRRERNPRYIYTLPSGQPSVLQEGDLLCDGETPLSTMPTNVISNPLDRSQNKVIMSEGDVQKSFAWRCPESNTAEDTSDDTYDGTESIKSDSPSFEESNYRSSTANLSGTMSSLQSNENWGLEREGKKITAAVETDRVEVFTPASIRDQIFSLKATTGNRDSDVVEGLDLDLEKLTLKTEISDDKNCGMHTKCERPETVMNTHDHPIHMIMPAAGHPLHGKVPKRKSSVYQRSFDYYSRPSVSQKTARKKSAGSVIARKFAVPDDTTEPDETSPQRQRPSFYTGRHNEPDILHSLKPDYTAETWKSLAKVSPERGNDTTRLSGRMVSQQQEEERPRDLETAYGNKPAELDESPREDSGELLSGLARIIMHDRCLHGVQDTPISSSTMKPTKSEVSLGNRRTEYVISGTRSPTPTHCLPSNNGIPGEIASAKAAERRSDGREVSTGSRSVARAMSSEEDSSDSECARDRIQREENVQVVVLPLPSPPPPPPPPPPQQTGINPPPVPSLINSPQQQQASVLQTSSIGISSSLLLGDPLPYRRHREDNTNQQRITDGESDGNSQRRSKNSQRLRRSLSESDSGPCRGSAECRSKCNCNCCWNRASNKMLCVQGGAVDTPEGLQDRPSPRVFPNLPDARLIQLGLASSSDGFDLCERMGEDELEQKYTALSIGLGTDRITLPRRLALSLRQRDQAERNLTTEVERMQRDIQALAPLCVDRESVERVERVRHQLEMISRCALRVSCTAELLGATHQERRVSRAALLADRYLQALRARCDKISAELAETKRILIENNIVIEENSSELIDDVVPRSRYRGVPSANRTTMTRRRASIATIIRPTTVNPLQEATKDNPRQQRTSVPARMTLRRPSLGYDNQRWDNEKLDRTDSSSSSIGELREIFEQAESRRSSREENNNLIRSQSSHFSVGSCESGDTDLWASARDDTVSFQAQTKDEELSDENWSSSRRTPLVFRTMHERFSRLPISWYILFVAIFFFGFYSNRFVTTRSAVPLKWWSVDEIMKRYLHVQRNVPPPL